MVGLSHHRAPLEVRERVAIDQAQWRAVMPRSVPTVLLSTCNRVELYAWCEGRRAAAVREIERSLAGCADMAVAQLRPFLSCLHGRDAVLHLVRVATGLDSLVVGEEQIRGQIREAAREAEQSHRLPAALRGVFQRASESARRIRGGTRLGTWPSIASAAVHIARRTLP